MPKYTKMAGKAAFKPSEYSVIPHCAKILTYSNGVALDLLIHLSVHVL